MWEHFPQIYSTLARDKSIIPALLLSHLVEYITGLFILLNKSESIPHFKRVMSIWVWGERRESIALFLESVKIPGRPQDSISLFCSDWEIVLEKLDNKVKWVHMYESIKSDISYLTTYLQQT